MEANPGQRKRAFNGRFKTPRSRSGCTLCRQRRVKCDEQKPSCRRCCNGGYQCAYEKPLLWPDEPRRVGKPRGVRSATRASPESIASPYSASSIVSPCSFQPVECVSSKWLNPFVDSLLADFDRLARDEAPTSNETGFVQETNAAQSEAEDDALPVIVPGFHNSLSSMRPSMAYPTEEDTSPFTKQLFDFYLHRMCLKCILLDKNSHSYRKVVVPIALQSSLVFNALLALAASQVLPYHTDSSYRQKTLQYQGYSLRTLAHRISRLGAGGSSESEILAAILMLCLLELMHNAFRRGISDSIDVDVHAFGAQRVLESSTFDSTKPHNVEMSSFLGQMLSARYLLQFTCHSDRVSHADAEGRARYWLSKTTRPTREVNCFAGCSNELLSLLCDIISAIRQHGSQPFPADDLDVLKATFSTRVQEVEQQELLRQESLPQFASISSEANRFLVIAEAYRHAAIILIELYLCPRGAPADYHLVKEHLLAILAESSMRSAFAIPPPGKACRSSPLWPIFIASCHVLDQSLQADIAAYFSHAMAQDGSTIDILEPILTTIQIVWQRQDTIEPEFPANDTLRFPWEHALASMGWELCWA